MPQSSLYYLVQPIAPRAHRFAVELRIQPTHAEPLMLSLPAWIPGSYMIRDFARNILAIEAVDEEGPLALEKLDKQTWRLVPRGHLVRVRLEVYAGDLSVRSAHLDDTHG